MIFAGKSFPKLQFFFLFVLISFSSCSDNNVPTIDNEEFIEIYARLLIIYELEVSKDYHDRLIDELFRHYQTTPAQLDSTLSYFNQNPEEWVTILDEVRKKIQALRVEFSPEVEVNRELPENPRPVLKKPTKTREQREVDQERGKRKKQEKIKERTKRKDLEK